MSLEDFGAPVRRDCECFSFRKSLRRGAEAPVTQSWS